VHHKTEVNAVIADPEILICQPPRLLLAGVFDAMAKFLEIKHRYCPADTSYSLGLDYAYVMAARSYEELSRKTADCLEAIQKGEVNEAFEQTVYTLIAATGAISGIARGSNQTALGHKFYEITRALYPAESKSYLHGELVGVGLLLQNEYNGERERNAELLAFMKKYGLPHSPESAGVPKEALPAFYDSIMKSSAMHDTAPEEAEKLHQSLEYLWRYA
jgi:glycerol dehydrogenase-like iron-containing ADH family enzyme